jgi:hypothetical protein
MGRRKKSRQNHPLVNHRIYDPSATAKPSAPTVSANEQEFLDLVQMAGFEPTWQLRNWQRYFLDESSYLKAGEEWLQAKMEGVSQPRIIDDVDRKLMNYKHEATPAPNQKWWQQSGYWNGAWQMDNDQPSRNWTKRWRGTELPLTPSLPAPSGRSATLHHCM